MASKPDARFTWAGLSTNETLAVSIDTIGAPTNVSNEAGAGNVGGSDDGVNPSEPASRWVRSPSQPFAAFRAARAVSLIVSFLAALAAHGMFLGFLGHAFGTARFCCIYITFGTCTLHTNLTSALRNERRPLRIPARPL